MALLAVSAVLMVVGLTGPSWVFSPANEAARIPAMTLAFDDLRTLTDAPGVPTVAMQDAYYGWLAWMLVVLIIVVGAVSIATRNGRAVLAGVVLCVFALVAHALAVKGTLSWSQAADQIADLRIGVYLMLVGFLAGIAALVTARRNPADLVTGSRDAVS